MHTVTGCQLQDNGARKIWFFRDNSQVVELTNVPLKLRFNFFDARNHVIRDKSLQGEMKKAIESYRKLRGIK